MTVPILRGFWGSSMTAIRFLQRSGLMMFARARAGRLGFSFCCSTIPRVCFSVSSGQPLCRLSTHSCHYELSVWQAPMATS